LNISWDSGDSGIIYKAGKRIKRLAIYGLKNLSYLNWIMPNKTKSVDYINNLDKVREVVRHNLGHELPVTPEHAQYAQIGRLVIDLVHGHELGLCTLNDFNNICAEEYKKLFRKNYIKRKV
jgi:hypothetical protein